MLAIVIQDYPKEIKWGKADGFNTGIWNDSSMDSACLACASPLVSSPAPEKKNRIKRGLMKFYLQAFCVGFYMKTFFKEVLDTIARN